MRKYGFQDSSVVVGDQIKNGEVNHLGLKEILVVAELVEEISAVVGDRLRRGICRIVEFDHRDSITRAGVALENKTKKVHRSLVRVVRLDITGGSEGLLSLKDVNKPQDQSKEKHQRTEKYQHTKVPRQSVCVVREREPEWSQNDYRCFGRAILRALLDRARRNTLQVCRGTRVRTSQTCKP